jgi:IS1 family transposase
MSVTCATFSCGAGKVASLNHNPMPYILTTDQQLLVLRLLVEGNSISGISRLTGIHRDTCSRLFVRFGAACQRFLDREMRDLTFNHVELDEIWTYCQKKEGHGEKEEHIANETGDTYIFVAFDQESRLVPAHRAGRRDETTTKELVEALKQCLKWPKPHESDDHAFKKGSYQPIIRISSDGWKPYEAAIAESFGKYAEYAQVVKNHQAANRDDFIKKRGCARQSCPGRNLDLADRAQQLNYSNADEAPYEAHTLLLQEARQSPSGDLGSLHELQLLLADQDAENHASSSSRHLR